MLGDRIPLPVLPLTESGSIQVMSIIKNAYVCVINGEPELFETREEAENHAMQVSYAWIDEFVNHHTPAPRIAVMSVHAWLKLKEDMAEHDRIMQCERRIEMAS
jgi:hypothetical protein